MLGADVGGGRVITGLVVIDLTVEDLCHDVDGRQLEDLALVPDGGEVLVNVGNRRYVTQRAADILHEHDHRLLIRIAGTNPGTVGTFVRAARDGYWSVAS